MRFARLFFLLLFIALFFTNLVPDTAIAVDIYVSKQELIELQNNLTKAILDQRENANHTWKMLASALVLLMQLGFLALEAGIARSKNSINVAQKNVTDFVVAACSFYLLGFGLMFGTSDFGWFGWDPTYFVWDQFDNDWHYTFFIFQTMFVGTAATIASGAVAERMKFSAYIAMSLVVSLFIYPIYGHWAWGNLLIPGNPAFLADRGFIDFAGSSVVHTVGASVGLAAVLILGPRLGKYNEDGSVNRIHGHSMVLASVGAAVLWLGWIGFNGGSADIHTPGFTRIVANTILALAFGGITALIIGRIKEKLYLPIYTVNGTLGGLVGITAGCDALAPHSAVLVGIICGSIVIYSIRFIEYTLKIDDVVGAISVHGTCGIIGTILAGALAMEEKILAGDRLQQIIVQLEGSILAIAWGFSVSYVFLGIYHRIVGIRISREQEEQGLNSVEHGSSLGTGILQERLLHVMEGQCDLTLRLDEQTGDETAELAIMFNPFLDKIHHLVRDISQYAKALHKTSEDFHRLSGSFAEGATRLTGHADLAHVSTDAVAKNTENAANISKDMHERITHISESAMSMAFDMDKVSNAIGHITNSIQEITISAKNANDVAHKATNMSKTAITTVKSLEEATEQIDDVVSLIKSIARQVHLLSLNATIEAMKAGESGKGFTVVAKEVKNLAKQTAKATNEIKQKIEKIKKDSTASMDVIHSISDVIETIGGAVNSITTSVEKQSFEAAEISSKILSTTESAKHVAKSVGDVASGAQEISATNQRNAEQTEKLSSSINNLMEEANNTYQNSRSIEMSSRDLAEMAEKVKSYSDMFKLDDSYQTLEAKHLQDMVRELENPVKDKSEDEGNDEDKDSKN